MTILDIWHKKVNPHNRRHAGKTHAEVFWASVNRRGEEECWEWQGYALNKAGYGSIVLAGKKWDAHRLSWIVHNGYIPDDMCVLHKCDNPKCVNPSHLFIGTRADNMRDMAQKGRRATVGNEVVSLVRKLYSTGHYTQAQIASMSGISQSMVCKIVNRAGRFNEEGVLL